MKHILFFCSLFLVLISCSKEAENNDFFECKIDGDQYKVEGILAYAVDDGAAQESISVYGLENADVGTDPVTIYFVLDDISGEGNYTLGDGQDGHGYYANQSQSILYTTIPDGGSGSVTIDDLDSERVKGSFNLTVKDDDGVSVSISSGKFDVSIR